MHPATGTSVGPHLAVVGVDDTFYDGKTEARSTACSGAGLVGSPEWLKRFSDKVISKTDPFVRDGDLRLCRLQRHVDQAAIGTMGHRVGDEVEQHSLELFGIGQGGEFVNI